MISTNKILYTHQLAYISVTPKVIKFHNLQFGQSRLNIFSHPILPGILNGVLIGILRRRILANFRLNASRDLSSPCECFFIMTKTTI